MKTNIELLRERIEQNYQEYRADVIEILDGGMVFDMAVEIAAVEDAYQLSQEHGWIDEAEAAYLLEFAEPLKMLADAWEEALFENGCDFRSVVEDVLDSDDNNEHYITAAYAGELKRKYGAGVYIREALFKELQEAGKKYRLLKNMLDEELYGEGVDI